MKPRPAKPSDEELMLAYGAGDKKAFTLLFERYKLRIFNYLLRHLGDRAAAEDLFQTAFLKIHRIRHSYRPSAAFSTWIFTIAANLLKDYKVSARRRPSMIELEEVSGKPAMGGAYSNPMLLADDKTPEAGYGQKEIADRIRQAVQSLPPDQREVILLAKYEGFKYEEIAQILHTSVAAVKVKVHRAIKSLQKNLETQLDEASFL